METVYLDTHAAVWLYAGEVERIPAQARRLIDSAQVMISPAVLLEIQFLREVGKVNIKPERFLRDMAEEIGLKVGQGSFTDIMLAAAGLSWMRDPFDRMIVAQAHLDEAPLITRDRTIMEHYRKSIWD
jgi:PIN domain nuclease of toxin-antitoxin system